MMNTNIEYTSLVINRFEVQNSVKTFALSTKYLKRMTKLAMLNIINRRLEIPKNEFIEKIAFEQVPYFVFKRKSANRFIQAHHKYGRGILEAIEKGYLKHWELVIVKKTTRKVLESYRFLYKYNNNKEQTGTGDAEKVAHAMLELLRNIENLPGAKWPENDVDLICEISYQDHTPTSYEPPNFRPIDIVAKSVGNFIQEFQLIGQINTGFHKLTGQARGLNFDAVSPVTEDQQTVNNKKQVSEKQQEFMQEGGESSQIRSESPVIKMIGKRSNNKRVNFDQTMESPPKKAKLSNSIEHLSSDLASVLSQELENCACQLRNLGPAFELINCSKCSDPVHAVCNGYFDSQPINSQNFICLSCTSSNKSKNRAQAHLRLVLYGMFNGDELEQALRNVKKPERKLILGKLETEGITQPGIKLINRVALEQAIRRRFTVDLNSENLA